MEKIEVRYYNSLYKTETSTESLWRRPIDISELYLPRPLSTNLPCTYLALCSVTVKWGHQQEVVRQTE